MPEEKSTWWSKVLRIVPSFLRMAKRKTEPKDAEVEESPEQAEASVSGSDEDGGAADNAYEREREAM